MIDALRAFGFEELMAPTEHSNGYHKTADGTCFGCGKPATTRKGAARLWCAACRTSGKPSAQRQADLRARRAQNG